MSELPSAKLLELLKGRAFADRRVRSRLTAVDRTPFQPFQISPGLGLAGNSDADVAALEPVSQGKTSPLQISKSN